MNEQLDTSRRDFLKKTAYVVPAILTLKAAPALAGTGSSHQPSESQTESGGSSNDSSSNKRRNKHHQNFIAKFVDWLF
jgi:hypothetical protein